MKPSLPTVCERFTAYYQRPGNGGWGSLHIILADGNVSDAHVEFCISHAAENGDTEGEALARVLLTMSRTQRRKLPRLLQERVNECC